MHRASILHIRQLLSLLEFEELRVTYKVSSGRVRKDPIKVGVSTIACSYSSRRHFSTTSSSYLFAFSGTRHVFQMSGTAYKARDDDCLQHCLRMLYSNCPRWGPLIFAGAICFHIMLMFQSSQQNCYRYPLLKRGQEKSSSVGAIDGKHFRCVLSAVSFEVEAAISLQGDVGGLRRKGKNERFWIIPFVTAEEIPRTRCQELPTTGAARTPWHRQLPHFMRWRICSDPSHAEAVHPNRMGESNARLWFNGRFNSARRVVENTFGIITSRLRVFHRSLHGFLDIVNSS